MIAYLGIGTNIGNRMKNLQDSIDALNLFIETVLDSIEAIAPLEL